MGTFKLVLGFTFIIVSVWVCAALMPPFFANYQFEDAIETEARMSTYSTKPEDQIRDTVFKKAQELEIPLIRDQIKVHRNGPTGTGTLLIETRYTVHVNLPLYPVDLQFTPSTKNKGAF